MSSWLSAKINALGERVMDSVLDAVVQNQDVHLKNLQNMQQVMLLLLVYVETSVYFPCWGGGAFLCFALPGTVRCSSQ